MQDSIARADASPVKPKIIVNDKGQKVRDYVWDDYLRRGRYKTRLSQDIDLNDKTLIINHTWGLGDVLYSTPALYGLKKKFPRVKIIYICRAIDVLQNNPYVDEVISFLDYDRIEDLYDDMTKSWYFADYDTPLKGGYDYKINLRTKPQLNEFMSSLLRKNPKELSKDESDFVNQASHSVITRYKMVALDMYCKHVYVNPEELSKEEMKVYYFPTETELSNARNFYKPIRAKGYKIITLMPHTSAPYKDYPHWKEVVKLCSLKYFWVILDSHVRDGEPWIGTNMANVSGCFNTRDAAALAIESDLNCSSDTGLLYVKAARGGNCVVTYGPHEPEPFLHYFPTAHGMRIERLKYTKGMEGMCSTGCFIDTESCHIKGNAAPCLEELSPVLIAEKIISLLEK